MNRILSILLCFLILVAPGCQSPFLSPEQRQTAIEETQAKQAAGELTEAQAQAIITALKSDQILSELYGERGSIDWGDLLWTLGTIGASIFGIRVYRGPARKPEENMALKKIAQQQP